MRCFLAIELPDEVRAALTDVSARLRLLPVKASWVRAEHMHLTVRFLGECNDGQVGDLSTHLRGGLAGIGPFPLVVEGIGAFPTVRRPSVVWAGAGPATGALAVVQARCEKAARSIGLPPETKAFHPHITLARIKDHRPPIELSHAIEREQAFVAGEFPVLGVSLLSSELTPRGPAYARIEEFPFA